MVDIERESPYSEHYILWMQKWFQSSSAAFYTPYNHAECHVRSTFQQQSRYVEEIFDVCSSSGENTIQINIYYLISELMHHLHLLLPYLLGGVKQLNIHLLHDFL